MSCKQQFELAQHVLVHEGSLIKNRIQHRALHAHLLLQIQQQQLLNVLGLEDDLFGTHLFDVLPRNAVEHEVDSWPSVQMQPS